MKKKFLSSLSLIAVVALGFAPPVMADTLPDQVELGRNSSGDPCLATRFWEDKAAKDSFAMSYTMTCRGATASRHLAVARKVAVQNAHEINATLNCGVAQQATVAGLGSVNARRCYDTLLGLETVETSFVVGKKHLSVSAVSYAQGPAEELLRLLAGQTIAFTDRGRTIAPGVDISQLASSGAVVAAGLTSADSDSAINQGLRFIRSGLYLEASRILNDGLSRLGADAPVNTRIEMLLVAGLADSNLRFFDSAQDYFKRVDGLLTANPNLPEYAGLENKRRSYLALDLLNRRNFSEAIGALSKLSVNSNSDTPPLMDPVTLRALNQPKSGNRAGVEGLVATPDIGSLSQLVIDTQASWARSIAYLAQNQIADAVKALAEADRSYAVLANEKVDQRQLRWLEARVERQRARLALRNGDSVAAVAALDKAISALRQAQAEGLNGPTLAETELERAGVIARGGGDTGALLANFDAAVNSLIASDSQGAILPPAIEQYLDLLVSDANAHPDGESAERFFRALQAVGDPAIARQFVALQSAVLSDSKMVAKIQDQTDLESEITRLRFALDANPAPDAKTTEQINEQRGKLEGQLIALRTELQGNLAYNAVNDAPVKIAELRDSLQVGEAYFKLTRVRNYIFGMLVDAKGVQIYRVKNPDIEVEPLAEKLRASIDGGGSKLPFYEVGTAYAMFQLLAGPVADRMLEAKALIVDANGPLQKFPIGVLVTDKESVTRYVASRAKAPYDYSNVNFLAKHVAISTALSPRSLVVSRKLWVSAAPLPFIGFAEHQPASLSAEIGGQMLSVGTGCETEKKVIASLTRELKPINARELDRAGEALGIGKPTSMTGGAFTDTAVKARTDLNQFQVLHFATHGLTEGQWGCGKSPPALVTSMAENNSDALLSFDEIAKLRLDANLVVLSACDTVAGISTSQARASGREEAGATLEGLVRAFLAANARAVMSTYWPISDAGESEDLIADFYRAARTGTIGEALKTAQSAIMAQPKSSHPLFWGAFFVVGDAQKPLLTGTAKVALHANGGVRQLAVKIQ